MQEGLKALGVPREQYVVSTKIFWGPDQTVNVNGVGLSRKHIIEAALAGLKRLGLSYADIIFCHRFDHETPLKETCDAMNWLVQKGYCMYWGTSEWSAANIFEAFAICAENHWTKPCADQALYNMQSRDRLELDYIRLFENYNYGTTIWSPLAGGLLTGKYNENIPDDSRIKVFENNSVIQRIFGSYLTEDKKGLSDYIKTMLKQLGDLAKELNITLPQLAMSWVLAFNRVSCAITGASKAEQLDETVKAVQIYKTFTPQVLERIEKILKNKPTPLVNWKTWQPLASIR